LRFVSNAMDPNSREALLQRLDAETLTWRGPALMLFARSACAVGAQGFVAAIFAPCHYRLLSMACWYGRSFGV
jgi:hypothetical protein